MGTPGRGVYADPRTLDELAATARFTETSPGVFDVEPWPVLLCNDPSTRAVYAPRSDPAVPVGIRTFVGECLGRTLPVVPTLH
jgi:hypothetical protein